jgi:hypothetical protein
MAYQNFENATTHQTKVAALNPPEGIGEHPQDFLNCGKYYSVFKYLFEEKENFEQKIKFTRH